MPVFNLDDLIVPAAEVKFGGEVISFSVLTLDQRGKVQAKLREIVPNPLEVAKRTLNNMLKPSRDDVDAIWRYAEQTYRFWPPVVESDEGIYWLTKDEGLQKYVFSMSANLEPDDPKLEKFYHTIRSETMLQLVGFIVSGKDPRTIDPKDQLPDSKA